MKQLQSCNPRLVQIHAGVLIGGDAFESSEHEAHELVVGEGFAGAGGEGRMATNFPLASLSRGAEEDLGVPTKRNPARPCLCRKPNPVTYG